jgi:O-antigen ligase
VISLIIISRTSGALLGYLVGLIYSTFFTKKNKRLIGIVLLTVAASLAIGFLVSMPAGTLKSVDNTLEKIELAKENINRVLSERKIDFYAIIERKGADVTSGLWRLYQWHRIMALFVDSTFDKVLFGYGIGTTDVLFKLKAHNDYLRLLLETGLIGLCLNLIVWLTLYRRMASQYRWIVIMIAVYCITENNYDHFPAMSILVLYMIGAGSKDTVEQTGAKYAAMMPVQTNNEVAQ